ncbi:MAG: UDP-N-acetylmuramoyl-tripeptide--D-alanyl-D-alanine ligase [Bacteroidia bacterium]|nr:MAG: UDP-N-acetylmuramoyl-tripeptide--D-alanyl-D-alanine ligase [Bacteroidia bacterium]
MNIEQLYQIFLSYNQKVCTDTRKIIPDSIFFALKGHNFDGNQFALQALQNGCAFAVIDNPEIAIQNEKCILVENVLKTLQQLATYHRQHLNIPILAITGSNGKTTTKELTTAVLSQKYKTHSTPGNLNNHIGVPLTLLQMTKEHEIAVIELGANHPGEIQELCEIVLPNYGIITSIGKEHLEGFGNLMNVMKTNGELYNYLIRHNGKIFLQIDNTDLINTLGLFNISYKEITHNQEKYILYSTKQFFEEQIDIQQTIQTIVLGEYIDEPTDIFVHLNWQTFNREKGYSPNYSIRTKLLAKHNFFNALAAVTAGIYFGVNAEQINDAISNYIPDKNRMQLVHTSKNNIVILDAYNANPTSMMAALNFFKQKNILKVQNVADSSNPTTTQNSKFSSNEKVLILGDMFELGEHSEKEHIEILNWIVENFKEGMVFLIGKEFQNAIGKFSCPNNCQHYLSADDFITTLKQGKISLSDKFILIKASRGMQLEKIVSYL